MLRVRPVAQVVRQAVAAAWRVYHPVRRPPRHTPASFGLPAERVSVAGAGGVRLACWFVPREGARDVVVLSHGMARDSGMVMPLVKILHEAGYHVTTFDMRNHGESGGDRRWRGRSPRYSIDFHRVVRHLMERPELAGARIACVGFSMGAWTALEVARWEPGTVRAVVCDSGPTLDVTAAIRRMYGAGRARLPRAHRGPILFRLGREAFTLASLFFLRPGPWPVPFGGHPTELLFIAGAEDPVVRPDDLRAQLAWYPEADLWVVPRAGHTTALIVAREEYGRRVLALLARAFGPPPVAA